MRIKVAVSAGCAAVSFGLAGLAIAQTAWTQITRADLEPCRSVIVQAHVKQLALIDQDIALYCQKGDKYNDQMCGSSYNWKSESKSYDDVEWYLEGNTRCESGEYPCFGGPVFNKEPSAGYRASQIEEFKKDAANGSTITPAMDFWDSSHKADNCAAGVWLKKAGYSVGATTVTNAAITPASSQSAATTSANTPAFQSKLQTSNADELLALVNELLTTGNIDVAKLARNALLQRFPDSPLVPVVAKLITSASQPGAAVATPALAPPVGDRFRLDSEPEVIAAFAQMGIQLAKWQNTNWLSTTDGTISASAVDCVGGKCLALQLKTFWALTPTTTFVRVNAWNIDKLYGRGSWSSTQYGYDFVVLVPNEGISLDELTKAVTNFRTFSSQFQAFMTAP